VIASNANDAVIADALVHGSAGGEHPRSLARQLSRNAGADTARRTGDDRSLVRNGRHAHIETVFSTPAEVLEK
jgi:hypothetical protein